MIRWYFCMMYDDHREPGVENTSPTGAGFAAKLVQRRSFHAPPLRARRPVEKNSQPCEPRGKPVQTTMKALSGGVIHFLVSVASLAISSGAHASSTPALAAL